MNRRFLTIDEYMNTKVAYLDNSIYNAIEKAFTDALGERIGKKILSKNIEKTVSELSANSFVNIMDCFTIM